MRAKPRRDYRRRPAKPDAGEQEAARQGSAGAELRILLLVAAVYAVVLIFFYQAASWRWPMVNDSDNATIVLEAASALHGNWILHGWYLGLDPYWGLELPLYVMAVAILGVGPWVMHIVPAVIYGVVVFVAIWSSAVDLPRHKALAAAIAVGLIAGLPSVEARIPILNYVLQGPIHVSTIGGALASMTMGYVAVSGSQERLLLRKRYLLLAAATLILALAIVNDPEAVAVGVLPLAGIGAVWAMSREVRRRRVGPWLLGQAVVAFGLAFLIDGLLRRAGGYQTPPFQPWIQPLASVWHNLGFAAVSLMDLYGASIFGKPVESLRTLTIGIHLVFLLAAAVATMSLLVQGLARRRGDLLGCLIAGGVVGNLLAFVLYTPETTDPTVARYILFTFVYGTVCLGRYFGLLWDRLRESLTDRLRVGGVLFAGVVGLMAVVAGFGQAFKYPTIVPPQTRVARILEERHLRIGLGTYWDASITTVLSRQAVKVRPVIVRDGRLLERYNSSRAWYRPEACTRAYGGRCRMFLVWGNTGSGESVNLRQVESVVGRPVRVFEVPSYGPEPYYIAVWDKNLFRDVQLGSH